ncbi:putative oxidoreductase, short-chain dehydrogenase/reductase [Pseudooceanicola batsensis HTCC2597]|uniref:Putative oxidoreductase, short-chain dehydrogenase/reductase n=1 Tax=Pseudooceanicola batsensis (strain ATCC BAA-863 / DSM 15984 / KCTC 12145 / HTCC2597) TaxID=252305 RepID=A3U144_PSEBH|nr:glucose 1-dehydrogenase [Pseudooceanicola batsensis]EAQ02027.1 putative oxidoreductase, short-chain dehydrogenase/reductase [Pseudooceanicola batsensis HTCC2597]
MSNRLKGRVALVTGGGRGIGRAICDAYAREGAAVGIMDLKSDVARSAADEINGAGGRALAITGNAGLRSDVFRAADETRQAFGPVTLLVNNAMWNRYGPLEDQDERLVDRMIDVGFKSVIWGYQAVVPQMREARGGAIVNIASPSAVLAMKNGIMYSSVKAAVAAATRSGAAEYGADNIRVNAIAPGPTQTEGANMVLSEEAWDRRRERVPIGRLGQPEDCANAAVFLASDEAAFISGDMTFVDGGITYAFS